jgi:8-oxo-dGTP pyrophosphatase MutT (NUDIX family)/ribosomal protein S18 acetylase RimI-like enzyme
MDDQRIRRLASPDAAFLFERMLDALNWGVQQVDAAAMRASPDLMRYVEGWGRPGDLGLVAEDDTGPLGAVWARLFTRAAPGYGFVDESTPELALAVVARARGRGVGTRLLSELLAGLAEAGPTAVSLSVDDGNDRAGRLYRQFGFVTVGRCQDSDTMVRRLRPTVRVAAVAFRRRDGAVATVRKRGTLAWMLPGGKPEPGETMAQAARREIGEELGLALGPDDLRALGTWVAPAANEVDHDVCATVFEAVYLGDGHPAAEIDAVRWTDPIDGLSDPTEAPLNRDWVYPLLLRRATRR